MTSDDDDEPTVAEGTAKPAVAEARLRAVLPTLPDQPIVPFGDDDEDTSVDEDVTQARPPPARPPPPVDETHPITGDFAAPTRLNPIEPARSASSDSLRPMTADFAPPTRENPVTSDSLRSMTSDFEPRKKMHPVVALALLFMVLLAFLLTVNWLRAESAAGPDGEPHGIRSLFSW